MEVCGCGCGIPLEGKRSKWLNEDHKNAFYSQARKVGVQALGYQGQLVLEPSKSLAAPFFNTVKLEGSELASANSRAKHQEEKILAFFRSNPGEHTPCEVHAHFPEWPLTSVRRAITNLTALGLLVKTQEKRRGNYGMNNFCWKRA